MNKIWSGLFFVLFLLCDTFGQEIPLHKIASGNRLTLRSGSEFGSRSKKFVFKENLDTFLYNDILMPLAVPVSKRQQKLYVDTIDYITHIKPLIFQHRYKYKKIKTIVLDAGHGGEDLGAVSKITGMTEKTLNMDVCLSLSKILKNHGYRVILTRQGDKKISLERRTQISNNANADLFICVHFNSAPSASASGIETFTLTPVNQPSFGKSRKISHRNVYSGNQFDNENLILGYYIQSSLVNTMANFDRGVKHANFTVLRGLNCPGVLIECGFLSNVIESRKISSRQYREKLAQAICDGIISFDNLSKN